MVVTIHTSEFNNGVIESHSLFENYLYVVIKDYLTPDKLSSVKIILPITLTKMQRYQIHRYSVRDKLMAESDDTDEGRVMTVKLSKDYVEHIYNEYYIHQPEPVPKTDKEMLLETLVGFIETNLYTEFMAYLDKY